MAGGGGGDAWTGGIGGGAASGDDEVDGGWPSATGGADRDAGPSVPVF